MQIKQFIEDSFLIDKADTGEYVPFKFNKVQEKYYQILLSEYGESNNFSGLREVILKARKEGFTSLILGIFAACMFLTKNPIRFLEISYKDDATKQHFRRLKGFILSFFEKDHMKWSTHLESKIFKSISEGEELVMQGNGASFYDGTASTRTGERGGTVQGILFSEAGHYPDTGIISASEIIEGTRNMVAVGSGMIFLESTANGINHYKKIWDMASRREVDYRPRFFSWREFYDEEQFNRIKDGFVDKRLIAQEYPENPSEAFLKDSDLAIIPASWITECVNNSLPIENHDRRLTVCDVAGEGDDETVIYDMIETKIVNQEIYRHVSLMDTVGRLQFHAVKNNSTLIAVDKVGEGSGVYSRLVEIFIGKPTMVYGFDSRLHAPDGRMHETYANYKSYAWYEVARPAFQNKKAIVPNDYILIEELATPCFEFRGGKIAIELKDKIKDRLGRSPNRGDTYVMGLDALTKCRSKLRMKTDGVGWNDSSYEPDYWAKRYASA